MAATLSDKSVGNVIRMVERWTRINTSLRGVN